MFFTFFLKNDGRALLPCPRPQFFQGIRYANDEIVTLLTVQTEIILG
jgi:hypothetical protein